LPEIIHELNWVDYLFVILLLGILYGGLRWGISGQILSLIGWVGMLFVSVTYYSPFSEAIFGSRLQKWSLPVSFFIIAGGFFVLVILLERSFKVKKEGEISFTDRITGAGVAVMKALILFGVIGMQLLLLPVDPVRNSVKDSSKTAMYFVEADAEIYCWMTGHFNLTKKRHKDDIVGDFISAASANKAIIRMR
jgi:uncharacterized membrane protein required for colicin V production